MLRRLLFIACFAPLAASAQQEPPVVKALPVKPAEVPVSAAPAVPSVQTPVAPTAAKPLATPLATTSAPKITYSQCNVDGPYIAMTYDDGPHATNTPRLLDMLKQRTIKATFFCVGQCVAEYPEIAKRIVDEGHEIASHSWSHPLLSNMSEAAVRDQIERTHQVIKQATGVETKIFRPPYGGFTQRQRNWAFANYRYRTILWDVDPLDWKVRNATRVESEILRQTVNGSIILSHDIHKSTIDAMPSTLDALTAKGFKFVTVSELLAMDRPVPPKPKTTPTPKTTVQRASTVP
jgi:peptidoglycan/xylan/chitin deacetylase (PgdA/CDA1 family)